MFIAVSLIALALGYQVYASALKEKEGLKLLGQIVGIFVMVAALFSAVCAIRCSIESCMIGSRCALMSKVCHEESEGVYPVSSKSVCPMHGASEQDK